MQRIIIFANGEIPDLDKARPLLQTAGYIICADGGTRHALALGVKPDLIVGDMDSAARGDLKRLQDDGVSIELYPPDKNETDLELALQRATGLGPGEIVVIAAIGGRLDQTLANIALLSEPRGPSLDIRLDDGVEEIFFCRDQAEVRGSRGDIVSLIPWGVPVLGVQTRGLRWPLNHETLYPEKTRGVSNEMTGALAEVRIERGLLLIVHRRS